MKAYIIISSLKLWDWNYGYKERVVKIFNTYEKAENYISTLNNKTYDYHIITKEIE